MNHRPGFSTTIAIILAVIIAVGGMSLVGSFVLCVGSDGHADLELAFGACCGDDDEHPADTGPSAGLFDSCGRCADIGLDSSSRIEGKQRLVPPRCAVIDAAGQLNATAVSMPDTGRAAASVPPHLDELRTVVLLT